jgi:ceramide glucosyltransferase
MTLRSAESPPRQCLQKPFADRAGMLETRMAVTVILGILALLSALLGLWQWVLAVRFPLHRRGPSPPGAPGVTLLKPLKGCDGETEACLRSWLDQDYAGPVQILFGVASEQDPACLVVHRLIAASPGRDARLVVCPDSIGPNAKVSTLAALEAQAAHEWVVVSDADVWAPADLLQNLLPPLGDPDFGLVCSFYRLARASNFPMRWEALAANADFWSSVLQAQSLKPLDFALGAVMALRRQDLAGLGGFRALAGYLADDYELGHRMAARGRRIVVCPVVVECRSSPMTTREVWAHQVRWSRTIRVCQPAPYFFSILSNATLWPLLWLLGRPQWPVAAAVAAMLLLRLLAARHAERKMNGPGQPAHWPLAWIKDLLQVPVWLLAFCGSRVSWRGRTFRVRPGGKIEPV